MTKLYERVKQKKFKLNSNRVLFFIAFSITAFIMFFTSSVPIDSQTGFAKMDNGTYYEYRMDLKEKVYILADGTVIFKGRVIKDVAQLSELVTSELAKKVDIQSHSPVALIADEYAAYGIIDNVLHELREANIGSVFMTNSQSVSLIQAMQEINSRKAGKKV